jgi:hypothetical protein
VLNFWLPETARDEWSTVNEAERATLDAAIFDGLLKQIDPRLQLRWIKAGARSFPEDCWARWLIVRLNEGTYPTYWVVQNPDGSYSEPDERHLEALRSLDEASHPGVYQRYRKRLAAEAADRQYRKTEKRREFRETLLDRLNHVFDVRVAVTAAHKEKLSGEDQGAAAPAAA